jgi:hypothetical protein
MPAPARVRRILTAAGMPALAIAGITLTACSGPATSHPAAATGTKPAPTVTVTAPRASTTTPAPTVTVTAPAPTATTTIPAAPADQVIARFNGSGTKDTPPFTVPASWHLSSKYWACPSPPDNFIVTEMNTDGNPDTSGVSINELGSGRGPVATYAYGDAGQHYFSVSTEGCS